MEYCNDFRSDLKFGQENEKKIAEKISTFITNKKPDNVPEYPPDIILLVAVVKPVLVALAVP